MHTVSLYTKRILYEPFDILAAFNGMCKLMEGTLNAPFLFEIPVSHFDLALLWEPVGISSRLTQPRINDIRYRDMRFPKWSWSGWRSTGIEYRHSMVEGCVSDVNSWLRTHTWIRWYIRDGYGTLRWLWDVSKNNEDRSTDKKWRGYDGTNSTRHHGRNVHDRNEVNEDDTSSQHSDLSSRTDISKVSHGEVDDDGFDNDDNAPVDLTTTHHRPNDDISVPQVTDERRVTLDTLETSEENPFGRSDHGSTILAIQGKTQENFRLTLPEDPFHVRTTNTIVRGGYRDTVGLPD